MSDEDERNPYYRSITKSKVTMKPLVYGSISREALTLQDVPLLACLIWSTVSASPLLAISSSLKPVPVQGSNFSKGLVWQKKCLEDGSSVLKWTIAGGRQTLWPQGLTALAPLPFSLGQSEINDRVPPRLPWLPLAQAIILHFDISQNFLTIWDTLAVVDTAGAYSDRSIVNPTL